MIHKFPNLNCVICIVPLSICRYRYQTIHMYMCVCNRDVFSDQRSVWIISSILSALSPGTYVPTYMHMYDLCVGLKETRT